MLCGICWFYLRSSILVYIQVCCVLYSSGAIGFIGMAACLLSRPSNEIQLTEKVVFACFFLGAITKHITFLKEYFGSAFYV